jgi:hypothetical protein
MPSAPGARTGGHRVGARPERRGHHEPVACDLRVQHLVHAHGHEHLTGSVAYHGSVVDSDRFAPVVPPDLETRDVDRRPPAFGDLVERGGRLVGRHGGQHADTAAGDAEHGPRRGRALMERRQRGPIASESDEQVAVGGLDGVDHPARLAVDRHLADLHGMGGGP